MSAINTFPPPSTATPVGVFSPEDTSTLTVLVDAVHLRIALLSVSAGQELVILIGAGGAGGKGCSPGGAGGNDGNSGIVLLEW